MARSTTTLLVLARRLGLLAILLVATFAIGTVDADAGVASQSPAADPARVRAHLVAFQDIADRHGGTRATDTPGFAESEAYAVASLQQAGWTVSVQTFTLPGTVPTVPPSLAQVGPVPATYALGTDYSLTTPPSGDDADAPLALVGITGVPDPSDGGGACEPGAFDGFPPGAIALVVYGSCDPLVVVTSAFSAGATGVGFISDGEPGEQDPVQVDVGISLGLASFSLSHALGASLVDQVRTAGPVQLRFDSGWRAGQVTSDNVIAERPGTRPDEVLVLGAHLDSVPASPGVTDDGSGASALLALAEAWGSSGLATGPTLRIGLWGAEERGLLGSQAYVASLGPADRAAVTAYLNFDMLSSANGFPLVYDPAVATDPTTVSPGSGALTERFRAYFEAAGIPTAPVWSDGRSDDRSFAVAGIPVGGLFSGAEQLKTAAQAAQYGGVAGEAYDRCYHLACDRLDRVNGVLLDQLVAGLSAVVGDLAVAPLTPISSTPPLVTSPVALPAFTG